MFNCIQKILLFGPFIKKLYANKVCNLVNRRFDTCISLSPSDSPYIIYVGIVRFTLFYWDKV